MSAKIVLPDSLPIETYPKKDETYPKRDPQKVKSSTCWSIFCKIVTYPACCKASIGHESRAAINASQNTLTSYSIQIRGHQTAVDTLLIRGQMKERKAVLISLGANFKYEDLRSEKGLLVSLFKLLKTQLGDVTVLIPNLSQTSNTNRVQEIVSCYDMLLKAEGFHPNDVLLYGHGDGAIYGTAAASQIQQEYSDSRINVVIDRSSSALYHDDEKEGEREKTKGHVRSGTNININTLVQELKGEIIAILSKNDETIPPQRSFARLVPRAHFEGRLTTLMVGMSSKEDAHFAEFTPEEANLIGGHIRNVLRIPQPDELQKYQPEKS